MIQNLPIPIKRNLFLTGAVNLDSVNKIMSGIVDINENDEYLKNIYLAHNMVYTPKPINLYIDSYGGAAYQCLGLISLMLSSYTPVDTYVTGCAMSSGFIIAICGRKRYCHRNSTYLYHQIYSTLSGKLEDLNNAIQESKHLQRQIEKITIDKTKISAKDLKRNFLNKKDWYINPEKALRFGIVDEII